MAREERTVLYYLERLWQNTGLELPVSVTTPDEAVAAIREQLEAGVLSPVQTRQVEAQLGVFERMLNRLTVESRIPRNELMSANPGFTFGSALETAAKTVERELHEAAPAPLREISEIAPLDRPLTAADLPPLPEDFWARFKGINKAIEDRVKEVTPSDMYQYDPFSVRSSALHYTEAEPFAHELGELMGVYHLLENDKGPVMFRPVQNALGRIDRSPAGRFWISPDETDPRLVWLRNQTIRFQTAIAGQGENLIYQYFPAGTSLRPEAVEGLQTIMDRVINKPGKTMIFDVETAGLNRAEGLWQISARLVDEEDKLIREITLQFHNPTMQWKGEIGRSRMSLEEWLGQNKVLLDYPEQLKEFYKMGEEADYMAGHNIPFDFGAIAHGIINPRTRHKAYSQDAELEALAQHWVDKFYNRNTREIGNVVDTAALARQYLHDITLAPELAHLETAQRFSLQNILLQTDLLDHVRRAEGGARVDAWLKQGTHYADVDVPLEHHLYRLLKQMARGQTGLSLNVDARGRGTTLRGWRRARVVHSSAITPTTKLTDIEQVNDKLIEKLMRSGLMEFHPDVLKQKRIDSVQALLDRGITTHEGLIEAFGGERDLTRAIRKINLTPLEQKVAMSRDYTQQIKEHIFSIPSSSFMETIRNSEGSMFRRLKAAFWDSPTAPNRDITELAYHVGLWKRLSNEFMTKRGEVRSVSGVFPSPEKWEAIQKELAEKGIPFAGSSMHERILMAVLGEVSSPGTASNEQLMRKLFGADIASLSKWYGAEDVGVISSRSGDIVRIPESLLIEAEKAGVFNTPEGEIRTAFGEHAAGKRVELYELSPFKMKSGQKDVGLMFHLGKGEQGDLERTRLLAFLKTKAESDDIVSEKNIAGLERALGSSANELYGIQVATAGAAGKRASARESSSRLYDVTTQIKGGEINSAESNMIPIYVAHTKVPFESDSNALYASGVVVGRHELLDEAQHAGLAYNQQHAVRLYEQAKSMSENNPMFRFFEKISQISDNSAVIDKFNFQAAHAYMAAKKKAPLIALGAVAAGTVYYRHRNNRNNRLYDQTMEYQDFESPDWYDSYQKDLDLSSRPIEYRQTPMKNPLSTAGLVKVLDRRKVQHTDMGSDKYGYLFSRGYS